MAIISNETYLERERERVRACGLVKLEAPAAPAQLAAVKEPGEVPDEQRTTVVALSRVSESQAAALRVLVAGRPMVEAATEAGVDRGTLYRWRTQDTHFMAALNAWRAETRAHARDRMLAMADKAIGAVAGGLDKGDARLGLRVLKDLECNQIGQVEPVDPFELAMANATPEEKDRKHTELTDVFRKFTSEQLMRTPQILQMGREADNARIAAEKVKAAGEAKAATAAVEANEADSR
jgi:hypothetical protein